MSEPVIGLTPEMVEAVRSTLYVATGKRMPTDAICHAMGVALVGHAVVKLPKVTDSQVNDPSFDAHALVRTGSGEPRVHVDAGDVESGGGDEDEICASWHADVAERVGLALLATAQEARRLAESPKGGDS